MYIFYLSVYSVIIEIRIIHDILWYLVVCQKSIFPTFQLVLKFGYTPTYSQSISFSVMPYLISVGVNFLLAHCISLSSLFSSFCNSTAHNLELLASVHSMNPWVVFCNGKLFILPIFLSFQTSLAYYLSTTFLIYLHLLMRLSIALSASPSL